MASVLKNGEVMKYGGEPKSLLGLLQRAAQFWPDNGIVFKDEGWKHETPVMTYADLLQEAKVSRPACMTRLRR